MKRIFTAIIFSTFIACISLNAQTNTFPSTGAAGIGTTTPNASSLLELNSTTKGILISRMTLTQRNAIVTPATGLMIYQTNSTPGFYYYTGSAWKALAAAGVNKSLSNLTAPTAVNVDLLAAADNNKSLGSSTTAWKNIYFKGGLFFGVNRFISNAGIGNTFIGESVGINNTGYSNTATGYSALYSNTSGSQNTTNGYEALYSNLSGNSNTANGYEALYFNTASNNTAIGAQALYLNTTGSSNIAIGTHALYGAINKGTGFANIAIGVGALANNDFFEIVAIGDSALYNNHYGENGSFEGGAENTAIGTKSLYANTVGYQNTATGYKTLDSNTTGYGNVAMGSQALFSNTTGNLNTAVGSYSLFSNINGYDNTATGYSALYSNTSAGVQSNGHDNTGTGAFALENNRYGFDNTATGAFALGSNTGGYNNTANGYNAMYRNTTGSQNVAIGHLAMYSSQQNRDAVAIGAFALHDYNNGLSDDNLVAVGYNALLHNTTGVNNTALGSSALLTNTSGQGNTASGSQALYYNTANNNTANGTLALYNNTTGSWNTAVGLQSLYTNTTGSSNTALGLLADVASNNLSNSTVIGAFTTVNASNKVQIGNTGVNTIGGQVGWSTFSDGRFKNNIKNNVPGLAFINKLKPVTYTLELKKFDEFLGRKDSRINGNQARSDYSVVEKKIHTGFIAQDVEKTAREIQYDFDGVNHPQNDRDNYSLVYADFVPSLVKAVQELSLKNDSLKNENASLRQDFNELKNLVLSIHQKQESCSPCSASNTGESNTYSAMVPDGASLQQNIPNPFAHTTTIGYSLPQKFINAQIVITDKSGKTLKSVTISGSGKGSLNVDASTLSSGAYQYSLFVDGRLIDTKQMILAK